MAVAIAISGNMMIQFIVHQAVGRRFCLPPNRYGRKAVEERPGSDRRATCESIRGPANGSIVDRIALSSASFPNDRRPWADLLPYDSCMDEKPPRPEESSGGRMRSPGSTRWLVTVGVVGALGVGATFGLVSAAGASTGTSSSVSNVVASPVTTASFRFSVSVSGLTPSAVTVTGTGQADLTNNAVSLAVNVPAVVAKLIPGGSASPEVINAVLSGDTIYLDIPSLASMVGEPWVSVALPSKATAAVPGIFTKVASALGNVNAIVGYAEAHHATVTSLGNATVDGVQATGSKIVATRSHKGKINTLSASVWADSANRLVQADVTTSGATKKGTLGLTATVDFTGYGSPATITVPPPSQVKTIPFSTVAMLLGKAHHRASRV